MKKYIALTAVTLILLAPGLAHAQSTSAVSRTPTVVERAAQEQGFEATSPSSSYIVPSLSTMAPMAPEAAPPAAPSAPYSSARPSLVTDNGLPKGLVMNGPGTEAYKKKQRKKKKAAAAVVAPVEAAPAEATNFAAPEPTPAASKAIEAPAPTPAPAMPASEAAPPADIPAIPAGDDPAMPSADPSMDPTPGELGPGGIEPPAPLTP